MYTAETYKAEHPTAKVQKSKAGWFSVDKPKKGDSGYFYEYGPFLTNGEQTVVRRFRKLDGKVI